MAGQFIALRSVAPNIGDWSAKVHVLAKMNPRMGVNTPTTYQKLLLGDAMGECMEAVIFNNDVELFENSLQIGRAYVISNANVSLASEKYKNQLATCQYQLTIGARTSVLHVENDETQFALPSPKLLDRKQFVKEIGKGTKISTLCVIIAKRLPRRMFLKERQDMLYEFAAIDKSMNPFVVSIWQNTVTNKVLDVLNSTDTRPVFMLMNFTVTDFYGVCLSSTSQSLLHDNYNNSAFNDMVTWRNTNNDAITNLIKQGGLFEEKLVQENVEMMQIKQVLELNKEGKFNILVKGKISNRKQKFYYMCCERCNCGTSGAYNSHFTCRSCAGTSVAKPRFRCSLNVYDESGDLDVILFGNDAEQIIGLSATDLYEIISEGNELPFDVINANLDAMWLRLKIRGVTNPNPRADQALSYNVVYIKCYEGDYDECKLLAAEQDPETSAYDVAKKETNGENNMNLPTMDSTIDDGAATVNDSVVKKRRIVKLGKRAVISDDDEEGTKQQSKATNNARELQGDVKKNKHMQGTVKKETYKDQRKEVQDKKDDSSEPTIAELFKRKSTGGKKKQYFEEGDTWNVAIVHKIPTAKDKVKKQQGDDKKNHDGTNEKESVKRSTRGRIIKPKKLD